MEKLANVTEDSVNEAETIIEREKYVQWGKEDVLFEMNDMYVGRKSALNEAGARGNMNTSMSLLNSKVAPLVSDVSEMRKTLNSSLVTKKDELLFSTVVATERLARIKITLSQFRENVVYADSMIKTAKPYRANILLGMYVGALVSVFSGFVGVVAYYTPFAFDDILISLLNITFFLSAFLSATAIVVASMAFSGSLLTGDTCKMLDIATTDFEPYLGSVAGEVATNCFATGAFNFSAITAFKSMRKAIDRDVGKVTDSNISEAFAGIEGEAATVRSAALSLTRWVWLGGGDRGL